MSQILRSVITSERPNHLTTDTLLLFQRIITVSLETMKIVRALPRLDFNTLS